MQWALHPCVAAVIVAAQAGLVGVATVEPLDGVVSGKDNSPPSRRPSTWNSFSGNGIRCQRRLGCRRIGR